jgi:Plastocyanin
MSLTHHWESRRGSQTSQERRAAPKPSRLCVFPTRISESVPVKRSNGITRLQSSRIPLPSGGAGEPSESFPRRNGRSDGARHAIIASTADSTHSGFIIAAPQERRGLPQAPLGVTRFRVTFPNPGIFPYICALHDEMGMVGQVTVTP